MHIMDIIQNSISARSTRIAIEIEEDTGQNVYRVILTDNGTGMNGETLKIVTDPFFTTRITRKVGIGLSLLKQNAERTGGWLSIESEICKGTRVEALFIHNHLDRPESGDIGGVIALSMISNPAIEFQYRHEVNGRKYGVSTAEIAEALEGLPLSDPAVYPVLSEMLRENIRNISNN